MMCSALFLSIGVALPPLLKPITKPNNFNRKLSGQPVQLDSEKEAA
jgi:hypothetical protein